MKLKVCRSEDFPAQISGKRLICFGAGKHIETICLRYPEWGLPGSVDYIVDNDASKHGTTKRIGDRDAPIRSLECLLRDADENVLLLFTLQDFIDIYHHLDELPELMDIPCYSPAMMQRYESDRRSYTGQTLPEDYSIGWTPKIPKVIHYCWFGRNPIPDRYLSYMESWKRYCPDYEIVQWNEDNYDVTKHPYMWEAYQAKKWGFVPDYARLDIIYEHGGFYLDTDVELLKCLDALRYHSAFCGFESDKHVNFGQGFGAARGMPVIKSLRDDYDAHRFLNPDGLYNLIPSPQYQTKALEERGLRMGGAFQGVDGMAVYPVEYFCPKSWVTGRLYMAEHCFSIHHFDASWLGEENKNRNKQIYKLLKIAEEVVK